MPIYEFTCECGKVEEKLFTISECPKSIACECGKEAPKTISGAVSFWFGGEGTYVKGYDLHSRTNRK